MNRKDFNDICTLQILANPEAKDKNPYALRSSLRGRRVGDEPGNGTEPNPLSELQRRPVRSGRRVFADAGARQAHLLFNLLCMRTDAQAAALGGC